MHVTLIKESMEELMKNRVLLRVQMQRVDLMIGLLGDELQKHEASAETRIASHNVAEK